MNRCTHELRVSYSKDEIVDENGQCHIHFLFEIVQFEFSYPCFGQILFTHLCHEK
jgi:hypothetical protein